MLQVIFKMDRDGNGDEIILDNVFDSAIQKPSFRNLNKELFTGKYLQLIKYFSSKECLIIWTLFKIAKTALKYFVSFIVICV